jgi:hypothetical protein
MTNERASANTPVVSRRALCLAIPASTATFASARSPELLESDPLIPLYLEWLSARREWQRLSDLPGNGNWDDPRSLAAEAREMALEDQMLKLKPTTLEGVGALAALAWVYVNPGASSSHEFEEEALGHDCRTIIAIWKACTGKEGYPEI